MDRLLISSLNFPQVPVKDMLIIKSISNLTSKLYYTILDFNGREIITNKIADVYEGLIEISVASLQQGLYFLKLEDDQNYVINSFTKE
jgi:hypothetical protein